MPEPYRSGAPSAPAPPRVVCPRCGRLQPPLPHGVRHCLYCGTALRRRAWVAHPPPTTRRAPVLPVRREPATPRYRTVPRWGFPPSVWVPERDRPRTAAPPAGLPRTLRVLAVLCLLAAVLALLAAAAETWRFVLVLRGRTLVLDAALVHASDVAVAVTGWTLLLVGTVTAVCVAAALTRAHPAAHQRLGVDPPRSATALWLRLLVPGWQLWGAGVVVLETEAVAAGRLSASGLPRPAVLVRWWWAAWVASVVLVVVTALRGLAASEQAQLDAVELHIALDLVGAVLAVLTAALLLRVRAAFAPRRRQGRRWRVRTPAPTRPLPADARAARRASGVLPPAGPVALPAFDDLPVLPAEPVGDGEAEETAAAGDDARTERSTPAAPVP